MSEYKKGMLATLGSQLAWGVLPIYWHTLRPISSFVIIFYRIFLVFVFSIIIAQRTYAWDEILNPIRNKATLIKYIFAGGIITVNWIIFIWAVNADYVL